MARTTAQTEISIVVNPVTGQLTAIPASPTVDRQSMVNWTLYRGEERAARDRSQLGITLVRTEGEFLLSFDDVGGFGTPQLRSQGGRGSLKALRPGTYHYKVAAAVGGQVFADLYCPSIIIR